MWQLSNPLFLWFLPVYWTWIAFGLRRHSGLSRRNVLLAGLGFTLGIIALSRPQMGHTVSQQHGLRSHLYLAVDISQSMSARDILPSRLDFAIAFSKKVLERLDGVKVALFPFAADGYLQMPLSRDIMAASDMLSSLNPNMTTDQGTDITESLSSLLVQIAKWENQAKDKNWDLAPTHVLLLSDGESHHPIEPKVLAEFSRRKIPIFTIAIGTTQGAEIRLEPRNFSLADPPQSRSSMSVKTRLEEEVLRNIANSTGGKYFPARFEEVPHVAEQLKRSMEIGQFETSFKVDRELFPIFLFFALVFLFLGFSGERWEFAIRILILALIPTSAWSQSFDDDQKAITLYNQSVQTMKQAPKDASEALQEALQLTSSEELKKKILFNLGNATLKEDPGQAIAYYQQAYDIDTKNPNFDKEANQKISDNMVLAMRIKQQQQSANQQGQSSETGEGKQQSQDPGGSKKDYDPESFSGSQKKKIFDLLSDEEMQTLQRVQEGRNRGKPHTAVEKPW